MRTLRPVPVLAGASAIALASLLVASPASAATLPSGQKITIVEQLRADVGPQASRVYNVDPGTALSTAIGAVQAQSNVLGIDVNDSGHGYATAYFFDGEDEFPSPLLVVADANTGALSAAVPIVATDDTLLNLCPAIDLQPNGEIIIACIDTRDGVLGGYIGTVTPEGAFTPFLRNGENVPVWDFEALATNPLTGELFAFTVAGGNGWVIPVNREAGTLGTAVPLTSQVFGADFDREGQLFVSSEEETLATVNTTTGAVSDVDTFHDEVNDIAPVDALTVWGTPALAATGAAVDVLPIGLGSALLLLAGAAFIATARLNRRAA